MDRELDNTVCANFAHTALDDKIYNTKYYNLDMIISVGYRVNSKRGIAFRKWATNLLKEYLIKGYNINQGFVAWIEKRVRCHSRVGGNPEKI
ncbi:RhuM family protein [Rickettsia sp. MEAM1 (Bemisia tabaci)]|uniref:RhuM family protein n=1 Tax=Rickettsia sp. MEAM1 (Bemisia tabaci) TaxID=1182263 RepID=UPI00397CA958